MTRAVISAIEYYLPAQVLTNEALATEFPEWNADKIAEKTGINARHIAGEKELSSDLAVNAARKLFAVAGVAPEQIDFVLLCTQTPDFALPTTACLVQHRLGVPCSAGAVDYNLGCSGYIYGLSLAKGLIETGQAKRVLLLTAETYSKLIDRQDKTVRTIFGDAGAATLISAVDGSAEYIGPFAFGTDGSGGANLVCHRGGFRGPTAEAAGREALFMNGPEIFNFTLRAVPDVVRRLTQAATIPIEAIDLFVFHQANRFMMEHLRKKLNVPLEKFVVALESFGNTVSCTIPIALSEARRAGNLKPGMLVMLVGFGVGYSWGATLVRWE